METGLASYVTTKAGGSFLPFFVDTPPLPHSVSLSIPFSQFALFSNGFLLLQTGKLLFSNKGNVKLQPCSCPESGKLTKFYSAVQNINNHRVIGIRRHTQTGLE